MHFSDLIKAFDIMKKGPNFSTYNSFFSQSIGNREYVFVASVNILRTLCGRGRQPVRPPMFISFDLIRRLRIHILSYHLIKNLISEPLVVRPLKKHLFCLRVFPLGFIFFYFFFSLIFSFDEEKVMFSVWFDPTPIHKGFVQLK